MNGTTDRRMGNAQNPEALMPPVDVIEDSGGITLIVDLPGVPKEALALQVERDKLIIEGEARLALPEGLQATHVELSPARYRRVFTLSGELDAERVGAEFTHGVLRLRIPRVQQAQPRRIRIDIG